MCGCCLQLLWSVPLPLETHPDPTATPPAAPLAAPPAAPAAAPAPAPAVKIAAFTHVVELDGLSIAASNGQLLLLDTVSREVEEVGVVPSGIAAAGWSPNGEQLAVLDYNGLLLIMNKVRAFLLVI
mgnify:CR=1 FL=1